MPIPLAVAAAAGFVKSGGLEGIIGGGKRKREEQQAIVEQRERQYDYENFDYNQDVGPINNPYAQQAAQTQQYQQQQIDRASANQLHLQQQAGNFGAAQAVIGAQADAAQQAAQRTNSIRQQGALFVEQQRQKRISDRYDQTGTFLARADNRLAEAKRARTRAKEKLYSGISGAATAVAGGLGGAQGGQLAGNAGGLANNQGLNFTQALQNNQIARQSVQATNLEDLGGGIEFYNDLDEI